MPKASPRASAHKFIVISDSACFTTYTGTREQLIAFGIAMPDQFPEGKKRLKWQISKGSDNFPPDDFSTKKLKGGIFEVKKYHEYRERPSEIPPILRKLEIRYRPGTDSKYEWAIWHGSEVELGEQAEQEINDALWSLLETLQHIKARNRKNPSYLKLVQTMTATGG